MVNRILGSLAFWEIAWDEEFTTLKYSDVATQNWTDNYGGGLVGRPREQPHPHPPKLGDSWV